MSSADRLIKLHKEGSEHPKRSRSRVCVCGKAIVSVGRHDSEDQESGEPIYENRCSNCAHSKTESLKLYFKKHPKEWARVQREQKAFEKRFNNRPCRICGIEKKHKGMAWCVSCGILETRRLIALGYGSEVSNKVLSYLEALR